MHVECRLGVGMIIVLSLEGLKYRGGKKSDFLYSLDSVPYGSSTGALGIVLSCSYYVVYLFRKTSRTILLGVAHQLSIPAQIVSYRL